MMIACIENAAGLSTMDETIGGKSVERLLCGFTIHRNY
jgi:hypothetical protein